MRFNEGALKFTGRTSTGDREGRLQYKSPKESYRQRWFKLKGNLLFYFRTNDMGQQSDPEPSGVLLLERCKVKLEPLSDRPFVFSIEFDGEPGRPHYFSGQTQQQCEDWVTSINTASFESLRAELMRLKARVQQKTGKDPVDDLYDRLFVPVRHKPQIPPPRIPTRPAPCPPQSASVFYNNGEREVSMGNSSQRSFTQSAARPWVKAESHTPGVPQLPDTAKLKTSGKKDVSRNRNVMSGWEMFD